MPKGMSLPKGMGGLSGLGNGMPGGLSGLGKKK
jgi:signal recognition particle subunit SRP54